MCTKYYAVVRNVTLDNSNSKKELISFLIVSRYRLQISCDRASVKYINVLFVAQLASLLSVKYSSQYLVLNI